MLHSFINLNPNSTRFEVLLHAAWALITTQIRELIDPTFVNVCHRHPVPSLHGWNSSKYVGTWYEQAHVIEFDVFQPKNSVCITAHYTANDDGTIKVENSYQDGDGSSISAPAGKRHGVTGKAKCDDSADQKGECHVSFFGMPYPSEPNYNVIDTNYDDFTIVYACDSMT